MCNLVAIDLIRLSEINKISIKTYNKSDDNASKIIRNLPFTYVRNIIKSRQVLEIFIVCAQIAQAQHSRF